MRAEILVKRKFKFKASIPDVFSISTETFLIELALSVYIFFSLLSRSFFYTILPKSIFQLVNLFCLAVLMLLELLATYNKRYASGFLVKSLLLFVCFFIFYRYMGAKSALLLLFILTSRLYDQNKLLKLAMYVSAFTLLIIVGASLIGAIENYQMIGIDGRKRQYLGFFYCLIPSLILSNISFLYVYLNQKKCRLLVILILIAANIWMYQKTLSRFSMLSTLLVLLLVVLMKFGIDWFKFLDQHRWIAYCLCLSFVAMSLISAVAFSIYQPNILWLRNLNSFVEGRISMTHRSIIYYGIPLFGQDVDWIGNGLTSEGKETPGAYLYVDNLYFNLIQRVGLIPFILISVFVTFSLFRAAKRKDYMLIILWVVLSVHGLIDNMIMGLFYNSLWIVFGFYFFEKEKQLNPFKKILKKWECTYEFLDNRC